MPTSQLRTPPGCHIPRKAINSSTSPHSSGVGRGTSNIESPVFIIAHCGQPLEPMLNLNQPFQHIAINNNLPMATSQHHRGSVLNSAFASEYGELIADSRIDAWIYGHSE